MEIIIKNLQKKIPINPKRIKKAILKVCSLEGKKSGEINICFVNDKKIRELNYRYLGKDYPTDVIAFDMSGKAATLQADIAISTDTAVSNAKAFDTTPAYELYLYLVHGLLHLLGYDDRSAKQRKLMEQRANSILRTLNIDR